ncbi:unnamed protein product [Rotaria magnacalcarata]|uniref:Uncharacterized protein n=1 Tax=Rotaria magnacalcarata TaxID=392030 RepID=A0A820RDR7_9BILA|nr:unnamed protein product [Rotaria magnacalcarata]
MNDTQSKNANDESHRRCCVKQELVTLQQQWNQQREEIVDLSRRIDIFREISHNICVVCDSLVNVLNHFHEHLQQVLTDSKIIDDISMSTIFRERKDIVDLRPDRIDGPKYHAYPWKMIARLELNEKGEDLDENDGSIVMSASSTTSDEYISNSDDDDNDIVSSRSYSPFDCDPFQSYDYEC